MNRLFFFNFAASHRTVHHVLRGNTAKTFLRVKESCEVASAGSSGANTSC